MQWKLVHQESIRCIERLNSSLVSTSLWLFLHLFFFLRSFRHHIRTIFRTEMANVEQTQKMIPFITCDISFAFISASWFLGSLYLIWIMASPLILSKSQSRATLWVLDTCLIVGLLPLTVVLITASLSSNTYNKASWWEDLIFEGRKNQHCPNHWSLSEIAFVFPLCEVVNDFTLVH